jgi:hypothetical protein
VQGARASVCDLHMPYTHINVPCHSGVARRKIAFGGDDVEVWRLAANVLNKQQRTRRKLWCFGLGVGRGTKMFSW